MAAEEQLADSHEGRVEQVKPFRADLPRDAEQWRYEVVPWHFGVRMDELESVQMLLDDLSVNDVSDLWR